MGWEETGRDRYGMRGVEWCGVVLGDLNVWGGVGVGCGEDFFSGAGNQAVVAPCLTSVWRAVCASVREADSVIITSRRCIASSRSRALHQEEL